MPRPRASDSTNRVGRNNLPSRDIHERVELVARLPYLSDEELDDLLEDLEDLGVEDSVYLAAVTIYTMADKSQKEIKRILRTNPMGQDISNVLKEWQRNQPPAMTGTAQLRLAVRAAIARTAYATLFEENKLQQLLYRARIDALDHLLSLIN